MDGNHPKRRKDKYNPYTIGTTGDGRHWLTFSDGQRHRHHLEINAAVFALFDSFELDDLSYLNEVDRHYVNHQLFTESVLEEVLLSMPGKDSDESPENVAKAEAILTEMDLLPYKACHPMGLSGGQKQRVAIASAIASERPVILFDEPTSGLDLFHMRQVADSVKGLADSGKTIVIVTHDPEFILRCCNYVIHLENGRLEESYFLQDTEGRERLFNFFMMEGGGGNQTV